MSVRRCRNQPAASGRSLDWRWDEPNAEFKATSRIPAVTHYRFVHLSDIHFGQERDGTLVPHEDVREELISDCRAAREKDGPAYGILLTGDTAFSGKRAEYKSASQWLDRLAEAIGCPKTSVYVIPGNHDVDLDSIDYNARMLHERMREATATEVQAQLEGLAKGNEEGHPLFRKLAAYREFAAQYDCDFESLARPIWQRDLQLGEPGEFTLRLVGLASVQVSNKQDAKGNMVLGNKQFIFPRLPGVEYVFLCHHPLEWFKDRAAAEDYLHTRARALLFGHEHLPRIKKVSYDDNSEFLVIDSGATNPPEQGGAYHYTFNWLEFSLRESGERCELVVKVHPRVWVQGRTFFVADSSRMDLTADGCKEFIVPCPQFKARPRPAALPAAPVAPEVPADAQPDAQGEAAMHNEEDEAFARLRLFFWRYLDWRQRLTVLAQLDLLPSTLDRPVPQTMERLALNTARAQKKLGELWSAVMNMVPDDRREENPFTAGV